MLAIIGTLLYVCSLTYNITLFVPENTSAWKCIWHTKCITCRIYVLHVGCSKKWAIKFGELLKISGSLNRGAVASTCSCRDAMDQRPKKSCQLLYCVGPSVVTIQLAWEWQADIQLLHLSACATDFFQYRWLYVISYHLRRLDHVTSYPAELPNSLNILVEHKNAIGETDCLLLCSKREEIWILDTKWSVPLPLSLMVNAILMNMINALGLLTDNVLSDIARYENQSCFVQ